MKFLTKEESFWADKFGDGYIKRNDITDLLPKKISLFAEILKFTKNANSFLEFGSNIGINLLALKQLIPKANLKAIEINNKAVNKLKKLNICSDVWQGSMLCYNKKYKVDLSFTAGVLIHISPDHLKLAYRSLYQSSKKYILICEYYNPNPVSLNYRGYKNKLYKRDFAGEIMENYPDLSLLNYGFRYNKDNNFPLDDVTWFLMEKK